MGETVVLRSVSSRALGGAIVVVAALLLGATALADLGTALRWLTPLTVLAVLGWAAFWQPRVEVSDGGIKVVNTLRTVLVPWPAVQDVEGRYGLTLRTTYGTVRAWGAQVPAGRARATGREGEAAVVVRERWSALRDAGFLDDAKLERADLPVTWHRGTVTVLAAGAVLAGATLLLG